MRAGSIWWRGKHRHHSPYRNNRNCPSYVFQGHSTNLATVFNQSPNPSSPRKPELSEADSPWGKGIWCRFLIQPKKQPTEVQQFINKIDELPRNHSALQLVLYAEVGGFWGLFLVIPAFDA